MRSFSLTKFDFETCNTKWKQARSKEKGINFIFNPEKDQVVFITCYFTENPKILTDEYKEKGFVKAIVVKFISGFDIPYEQNGDIGYVYIDQNDFKEIYKDITRMIDAALFAFDIQLETRDSGTIEDLIKNEYIRILNFLI